MEWIMVTTRGSTVLGKLCTRQIFLPKLQLWSGVSKRLLFNKAFLLSSVFVLHLHKYMNIEKSGKRGKKCISLVIVIHTLSHSVFLQLLNKYANSLEHGVNSSSRILVTNASCFVLKMEYESRKYLIKEFSSFLFRKETHSPFRQPWPLYSATKSLAKQVWAQKIL